MAKIVWDETGSRYFENGTRNGVLYVMNNDGTYANGVAWNGLISVSDSPDGGDVTELWADDIKYASFRATENAGGTIEAYTYPEEFEACDGSAELADGVTVHQQERKKFGFCYRTNVGNDVSSEAGYKLHIVYNASAAPSEKSYETINDSPDAITFSWDYTADPISIPGHSPSATITIDSTKATAEHMAALETLLYGGSNAEPTLPTPATIITTMGGTVPAAG